jgi:cytochrome c553
MKATILRLLVALLPLSLPLAAHAEKLMMPADAPPAFQAECAGCHLAFPAQLLVADDWKRVMAKLEKHYGGDASLDEKTRLTIENFLIKYAGDAKKIGASGTAAGATEPPRLTATAWFKRKHHEVPQADWHHAKVKTASNCAACHTRAAEGSYREREIVMPNGKKWE